MKTSVISIVNNVTYTNDFKKQVSHDVITNNNNNDNNNRNNCC